MIAYYLLMTIGARSLENFFLTAFLFALLLFKMAMNGLAIEYLWSDFIWWANASVAFAVPFVFHTALLNAYSFLPVKNYRRLQIAYYVLILLTGLQCLASFFLPYIAVKAYVMTGLCATLLIFSSSIFMLIRGATARPPPGAGRGRGQGAQGLKAGRQRIHHGRQRVCQQAKIIDTEAAK
jgi:hypothetical protein